MIGIYRNVRNISGHKISPEVRSVMDRMLATEDEIDQSRKMFEAKAEYEKMLESADERDQKSLERKEKARVAAEEKIFALTVREWQRNGGVERVKEDAEKEISGQQVYRLVEDLQKSPLDPAGVAAVLGDEYAGKLSHHGEILKDGGQDIEVVAADYGYEDGAAMLVDLERARSKTQAVDLRADDMLNEQLLKLRHILREGGHDGFHDDEVTQELLEYHNTVARELVQEQTSNPLEQNEALRRWMVDAAAMREVARERVSSMKVGELTLAYARKNERAALRHYEKFAATGNREDMLGASRERIFWNFVFNQISATRRDINKFSTNYSRGKLSQKLRNCEEDYEQSIIEIAKAYLWPEETGEKWQPKNDDGPVSLPVRNTFTTTGRGSQEIDSRIEDPATYVPEWIINKKRPKQYTGINDLTVGQLDELETALNLLMRDGRGELSALKDNQKQTVVEMAQTLFGTMSKLKDQKVVSIEDGKLKASVFEKLRKSQASFKMMEFLFEEIDGFASLQNKGEAGAGRKIFNKTIEAETEYEQRLQDVYTKMQPHFDTLNAAKKRIAKERGKFFDIDLVPIPPEIQKRYGRKKWDAEMVIAAALNMGNDANLYALTNSYQLTGDQLRSLQKVLSSDAWEAVQGIWDSINTLFTPMDDVYYRMSGKRLVKEPAVGFAVESADGEIMNLDGGYYPLKYDAKIDQDMAAREELNESRFALKRRAMKTRDGQSKARKRDEDGDATVIRPPMLSVSRVLPRHINDTVRDITHRELIRDLDMVTREYLFAETFVDKFGEDMYNSVRDWIGYIATPVKFSVGDFDRYLDKARKLNSIAALGLNFKVGVKQRLSIFNAISAMNKSGNGGYKYFLKGVQSVGFKTALYGSQSNEAVQQVLELSDYMKSRQDAYDLNIRDIVKDMKPFDDETGITILGRRFTLRDMQEGAFSWIRANDHATVYPLWNGAFQQALDQNLGGIHKGMGRDEQIDRAAKYADSIVRTTQPSTLAPDLSSAQRNAGILRFFTSFMTFTLKNGNLLTHNFRAWREGALTNRQFITHVVENFYLPRFAMIAAAWAFLPDEEEDDNMLMNAAVDPVKDMLGTAPVLRELGSATDFQRKFSELAALRGVDPLLNGIYQAGQGKADRASLEFIKLSAWLAGVPWKGAWSSYKTIDHMVTREKDK